MISQKVMQPSIFVKIANYIGEHLLKYSNPRVVCPPGKLSIGQGELVLVPTLIRSGTHLLIDAIINNFPQYKRTPLYVDLDALLNDSSTRDNQVEKLIKCGGYALKTHFPQVNFHPDREVFIRKIAASSKIITIERNLDDSFYSCKAWSKTYPIAQSQETYLQSVDMFRNFWGQYDCMKVSFSEIIDRDRFADLVHRIGNYIGVSPRIRTIYSPRPDEILNVYMIKTITRILGQYSPVVNTTIKFR
jgi:hypothetical protein